VKLFLNSWVFSELAAFVSCAFCSLILLFYKIYYTVVKKFSVLTIVTEGGLIGLRKDSILEKLNLCLECMRVVVIFI
jgi:hypothetical protein